MKKIVFIIIMCIGCISLNFMQNTPNLLQSAKIKPGLDIKGGVSVTLFMDIEGEFKNRLNEAAKGTEALGYEVKSQNKEFTIQIKEGANTNEIIDKVYAKFPYLSFTTNQEQIIVKISDVYRMSRTKQIIKITRNNIRNRVDSLGVAGAELMVIDGTLLAVEIPGVYEIQNIKNIIGRTAYLKFYTGMIKDGKVYRSNDPFLNGENIELATPTIDPYGQPVVNLMFDNAGGMKMAENTNDNIGNLLIITLDDAVITEATIKARISTSGAISVGSIEEAQNLSKLINAGMLPVEINIVEEELIGPSLSTKVITYGILASIIAILVIICTMCMIYGISRGSVTLLSIIINGLLIASASTILGVTLTLASIVSLILVLGMSVDANIIIYEQLKYKNNREFAISDAMSTIMTANITTMIAALMISVMSYGALKGFGIMMTIGLISTLLSIILIKKLFK